MKQDKISWWCVHQWTIEVSLMSQTVQQNLAMVKAVVGFKKNF